ncbi:hypothetical protein CJA_0065 [Cellvibrio japonicus Ueda107]|uniref:Uncharacterized protein n=1 Tax=Cellvibrio japonicus (strain Ueda107) TaxID=498211 RepID=B3PFE9_CELJU|nr:hypothetical protein CJA_0065 [Cellvibrio japonicus Ueda107]
MPDHLSPWSKQLCVVCSTSNPAQNCLMHIKPEAPQLAHSDPEAARHNSGEFIMLVSGIVATASLVGILAALFVASLVLVVVDNRFDANRSH